MYKVRWLIGIAFLLCNSICDVRNRKVSVKSIAIFIPLIGILNLLDKSWHIEKGLIGCVPGLVLMLISWIKPMALGMGDGICVLLLGFVWGFEDLLGICLLAFIAASVIGVILIVIKKATRATRFPFVPFLFIASIVISIKGW